MARSRARPSNTFLDGAAMKAPGVAVEAGDLLALDQGGREVVGGDRRAADLGGPRAPELGHHVAVLVPDLAAEIAGVPGAGAVACGLGIEDHRLTAPAREGERGGKPDVARAHDHHLSLSRRRLVRDIRPRREIPPIGRGLEIRRQHVPRQPIYQTYSTLTIAYTLTFTHRPYTSTTLSATLPSPPPLPVPFCPADSMYLMPHHQNATVSSIFCLRSG